MSNFVLLLDNSLAVFYRKNIFSLESTWPPKEIPVGIIILFLFFYALYASYFLPIMRYVSGLIVIIINNNTRLLSFPKERDADYKWPHLVMKEAIIAKDAFNYNLACSHNKNTEAMNKNLTLGFGIPILLLINYFVGSVELPSVSMEIIAFAWPLEVHWINYVVRAATIAFGILAIILLGMSLNPNVDDKMYCPTKEPEKIRPTDAMPNCLVKEVGEDF